MGRLVVRRLLSLVPLLFVVSVLVFGLIVLLPGDRARAIAGDDATPDQVAEVRHSLGLDRPLAVQYGRWINGVAHGDLGTSVFVRYEVSDAIRDRAPVTISLIGAGLVLSLVVGIPLGALAGSHAGGKLDRAVTLGAAGGVALPNFWLGLLLLLVFTTVFQWLPATGYVGLSTSVVEWLRHLALPALTLGAAGAAEIVFQTRAGVSNVLQQDYIRTLRATGLRRRSIVGKHALKNAMVPVVTVAGLQISRLFGFSVIVERIFGLPGIGSLAVEAVFKRDVPVIQGVVLVVTVVVLLTNLLVDLSYGYFNPKVRAA
ncbi:MAG: ABC transporter permease [Acidimicrobiales bacterium]